MITDVFPGGMFIATSPNLNNPCRGTTAGGTAGASNLGPADQTSEIDWAEYVDVTPEQQQK